MTRSVGGHGTAGTPAHLAGLHADPDAPSTHLSSGRVQAGGAEYEGVDPLIDEYDDGTTKRAGRPKIKKENLPVHVVP